MSHHTYPEYLTDIRAAFDGPAAQHGLSFKQIGTMPGYANAHLTLYFGMDAGQPVPYLKIGDRPVMTAEAALKAAGLPPVQLPAKVASSRELGQVMLGKWLQALSSLLPDLAAGKTERLNLPSVADEAYEQRLRTYVYNHAPIVHIARTHLWQADWREHAERFLKETGKSLD
ncbi:MAG: hypothetical protein U0176_11165 [Bacteroidia bacterium]